MDKSPLSSSSFLFFPFKSKKHIFESGLSSSLLSRVQIEKEVICGVSCALLWRDRKLELSSGLLMSFNDRAPRRGSAIRRDSASMTQGGSGASLEGGAGGLSGDLQEYQKVSLKIKEKVSELRRQRVVNASQKEELDTRIQDMKSMEIRIKNELDSQLKGLDQLPRTEIAQKRIALGKISKDFDRIKQLVVLTISEASAIKVDANAKATSGAAGGDSVFRMDQGKGGDGKNIQGGQQQFQQQIVGQEVDDLIAEEREKDIKKMNQDLRLVNEMFKDMAEIVEKQNPHIEQIAEQTEKSHERAQAGLEQVQQAAAHQSNGCVMA